MEIALLVFVILIIVVCALIFAYLNKKCNNENFAVEYKSTALLKYMHRAGNTSVFYHDPYTYSYIGFGERPPNTYLLPFMCMKFPDKKIQDWTAEDNNPLELIRTCINSDQCSFSKDFMLPCKVSQMYSLDASNPIKSVVENIKSDIKNNMKEYVDKTGINILAPVYVVVIQYPNKWDTDGKNINGYHYSQFDVEDLNPKPCIRRNLWSDDFTVCNRVDTNMIIVYPMYSKIPGQFYNYNVTDAKYDLVLPDEIAGNLKKDLPVKPNVKGIVDMIKFFGRYASKNQLCFIECNNDSSLVCGCGTRKDGAENPDADATTAYKSFCKGPYDPENDDSRYNFSHYAFMYRVNEREKILNSDSLSNYIMDVNLSTFFENKISDFLRS